MNGIPTVSPTLTSASAQPPRPAHPTCFIGPAHVRVSRSDRTRVLRAKISAVLLHPGKLRGLHFPFLSIYYTFSFRQLMVVRCAKDP